MSDAETEERIKATPCFNFRDLYFCGKRGGGNKNFVLPSSKVHIFFASFALPRTNFEKGYDSFWRQEKVTPICHRPPGRQGKRRKERRGARGGGQSEQPHPWQKEGGRKGRSYVIRERKSLLPFFFWLLFRAEKYGNRRRERTKTEKRKRLFQGNSAIFSPVKEKMKKASSRAGGRREKRGNVRRIAKAGERVSLPPPTNHLLFSSFSSLFRGGREAPCCRGGKETLKSLSSLSRGKARGGGGRKKRRGSLLPPSLPFYHLQKERGKGVCHRSCVSTSLIGGEDGRPFFFLRWGQHDSPSKSV